MPRMTPGRSVTLFMVWELSALGYMAGSATTADPTILGFFVFYFALVLFLALTALYLVVLNKREDTARELFSLDVTQSVLGIVVGSAATFLVLFLVFGLTSAFRPLPLDLVLQQVLVVVPAEEFAFRFFLPRILPFQPAWLFAQVSFALFHWRAFALDPWLILMAFLFGLGMYAITLLGRRTVFMGLGAAMGIHGVWNFFAFALTGQAIPVALL